MTEHEADAEPLGFKPVASSQESSQLPGVAKLPGLAGVGMTTTTTTSINNNNYYYYQPMVRVGSPDLHFLQCPRCQTARTRWYDLLFVYVCVLGLYMYMYTTIVVGYNLSNIRLGRRWMRASSCRSTACCAPSTARPRNAQLLEIAYGTGNMHVLECMDASVCSWVTPLCLGGK